MRRIAITVLCLLTWCAAGAQAQGQSQASVERGHSATEADVLCAGMVTPEKLSYETYIISGEEADPQTVFASGQYVYINHGSGAGVKVGDQFMVLRKVQDFLHVQFFDEEHKLSNAMGKQWEDVARVRVVVVHPNTSIAQIIYACSYVERGDYVLPAVDYPVYPFRPLKDLDRFAPPSGKVSGRVVRAKNLRALEDRGAVVYINVTGVKPGDYIRFYRPTARKDNAIYQIGGMSDHVFGFGKTPQPWHPADLPREVIGEGVVLRVTPSSASVLPGFSVERPRRPMPGPFVFQGAAPPGGRCPDSENTSAVKRAIVAPGSRQAPAGRPAFLQVSSTNLWAPHCRSAATCGSKRPRAASNVTITP